MPEQESEVKEMLIKCHHAKINPFVIFHESDVYLKFTNTEMKQVVFRKTPSFCCEKDGILALLG